MSVNTDVAGGAATICTGCLSIDRKLVTIWDTEQKVYFSRLLDSMMCMRDSLQLCWECAAHVRRALAFQKRVNMATALLSQLEFVSKKHTLSPLFVGETVRASCGAGAPRGAGAREPMAFVKIEHAESDMFSMEVDDDQTSDHLIDDVIDSDGLLNTQDAPAQVKERSPSVDSDDIPLNLHATRHEGAPQDTKPPKAPKTRRKGKKEDKKEDRRKNPAPKKEKPAGVVINSRVRRKLSELNVDSSQIEMVVLSWEQVEAERARALASETFTRHAYRCYGCAVGFNHRVKLENHMKKHHESSGAHPCSVCGARFRSAPALLAHRRRHRARWRCATCGHLSSRAAVAADHAARLHPPHQGAVGGVEGVQHRCRACPHVAPTLGRLRIHLRAHRERQRCHLCAKSFRDTASLRTHLFIHRGEKEYACTQCDKRFLFKKAMEIHMVTHQASASLYCYECDMNFKNQMSYYQHMKYNLKHIDPAKLKYACQLCDKKFVKATRLEEHHVAVHLKATPIRCTVADCTFACSSRPVLRTHTRMVHRNHRAVRNHVCDTCGKAYTTKKTLEGHLRSHTGERPFHCALCPSTFGYEAALYNHNKLVHLKAKRGRRPVAPPGPPAAPLWGGQGHIEGEEVRAQPEPMPI